MANTSLYERVSIVWEFESDKCPCLFKGEELKLKGEQTRGSIAAVIDRNDTYWTNGIYIYIYIPFVQEKKNERERRKRR